MSVSLASAKMLQVGLISSGPRIPSLIPSLHAMAQNVLKCTSESKREKQVFFPTSIQNITDFRNKYTATST